MKLYDIQKVNEIAKQFPRPRNYENIKSDISTRGIQMPLIISTKSELVCGYTRYQIASELNIEDVPVGEPIAFANMNEMKRYAILDNDLRRQMTDLERYEYVVKPLLEMEQEEAEKRRLAQLKKGNSRQTHNASNGEVGKAADLVGEQVGWSGDKVQRLKKISENVVTSAKELINTGDISQKDALALAKQEPEVQREVVAKVRAGKSMKKSIKESKKEQLNSSFTGDELPPNIEIIHGTIEEDGKSIADNSIDLIFTDPPYPAEYLPLWDELAGFAYRTLKPSGFLITYSGQFHLPEVMSKLSRTLDYYWTFSLNHSGNKQLINPRQLFCGWKPILIFAKPPLITTENRIDDVIIGSGREKSLHEWQQALEEVKPLIETFSKEGNLIVDPFCGSGTIPLAAYKLNRRAIGIEKELDNITIAKGRISKKVDKIGKN